MRMPWQNRNWNKVPTYLRDKDLIAQEEFSHLTASTICAIYKLNSLTDKGKELLKTKLNVEQGYLCPICHRHFTDTLKPSLDHDHETHRIRGVLCHMCNIGLGSFRDSPLILDNAIAYLLNHSKVKK